MGEDEWLHSHGLVITTRRLILRGEDPDDDACVAAMFRIRNDEEALKLVPFKPLKDLEESRQVMLTRLKRKGNFNFMIELREPDDQPDDQPRPVKAANLIGICGGVRTPEFGYWISSQHWGKGYVVEAMRAVLEAYWRTWPQGIPSLPEDQRHVVHLIISPENSASLAVARKLGGMKIGEKVVEEEEEVGPDGAKKKNYTLHIYAIRRPSASEIASMPHAYETMQVVGPNFAEGPPSKTDERSL